MAGYEGKTQQNPKRGKNETPESPVKTKQDINATLDVILRRINEVHELALSTQKVNGRMELELAAIRADLHAANEKITAVEARVSNVEDARKLTDREVRAVVTTTTALQRQLSEQDDKSRRGNIRILGVPEGEEDKMGSITTLVETLIPKITNLNFDKGFEIDKAYRIPAVRSTSRKGPRPIICRPLRSQHAEDVFAVTRKNQNLQWNGEKIILTQDYSKATVDTRKGFLALRDNLRKDNIVFSFVGPARFKITDRGKTQTFEDPRELRNYLRGHRPEEMDTAKPGSTKRKTSLWSTPRGVPGAQRSLPLKGHQTSR